MASPDSDQRFHQKPELFVPIKGDFMGKDVISMSQLDRPSFERLFDVSEQMKRDLKTYSVPRLLGGIPVALIFAEPSTRTSASFGGAVLYLGGDLLRSEYFPGVEDPEFNYTVLDYKVWCRKGIIVLRHPQEGAVRKAAEVLRNVVPEVVVPIMNAGDGTGEHPTQTMLDIFTMRKYFGTLDGLRGVIAGDLKNGRTVHSLVRGLSCFEGNTVYLLASPELSLREEERSHFASLPINIIEIQDSGQIPRDLHFWYWTRVQKERITDPEEYETVKDSMVLTQDLLKRRGNPDMIIMHPGPIINEIERPIIDDDPRCKYFEQVINGLPIRMALLALVLGKA